MDGRWRESVVSISIDARPPLVVPSGEYDTALSFPCVVLDGRISCVAPWEVEGTTPSSDEEGRQGEGPQKTPSVGWPPPPPPLSSCFFPPHSVSAISGCNGEDNVICEREQTIGGTREGRPGWWRAPAAPAVAAREEDTAVVPSPLPAREIGGLALGGPAWCCGWWERRRGETGREDAIEEEDDDDDDEKEVENNAPVAALLSPPLRAAKAVWIAASALACNTHCRRRRKAMDGCEVGLVWWWWWCGVSPGRYDEDDDEEESVEKAESEPEERREDDDDDDDAEIEKEEKEVGEVPPTRSRRRPCRWCGPPGK